MEIVLLVIHYLICLFLIIAILLQVGKGADIGAVFGGASQTVFGGRGPATFLNKMTAIVAVTFLATSIWLAHISKTRSGSSVIDKASPVATQPAIPAAEQQQPSGQTPPDVMPSDPAKEAAPETSPKK